MFRKGITTAIAVSALALAAVGCSADDALTDANETTPPEAVETPRISPHAANEYVDRRLTPATARMIVPLRSVGAGELHRGTGRTSAPEGAATFP